MSFFMAKLPEPFIRIGCVRSWWTTPQCGIRFEDHLASAGIETRPIFHPVHTMPMYARRFQRMPIAESIGWRGVNLPSWPGLADSQIDEICDRVRMFVQ